MELKYVEGIKNLSGGYDFDFMTEHPLYTKRKKQWQQIYDWIEGSDAVKAKAEQYIPRGLGMSDARYKAYVDRAVLVNYVSQTHDGTHGMIFRRKPQVAIPEGMVSVVDNINREGSDLYQFLSDSVSDLMITGFGGWLADYPVANPDLNLYDAEKMGFRAYATYYSAMNIINWKYEVVGGTKIPVYIVLREKIEIPGSSIFSHEEGYQYRILMIDEEGNYIQRLMKPYAANLFTQEDISFTVRGKHINFIPFVFAPSNIPDVPMLKHICDVNIGHLRKSADYENAVHLTTYPTGYVTGESPQMDKNKNIQPIYLGSDQFIMFPNKDAKVGMLDYAGNGLVHNEEALRASELQMVVLGSRIITPEKGISETAESANIHRAGENAKLATFANNVSVGATKLLNILAYLQGVEQNCQVVLNTDYETQGFDANALNAMANIFEKGKLPLIVLYSMMMKGEFMDPNMTFDDYVELLDLENSGLTPKEVYEAYKLFKDPKTRKQVKVAPRRRISEEDKNPVKKDLEDRKEVE